MWENEERKRGNEMENDIGEMGRLTKGKTRNGKWDRWNGMGKMR